MPLTAHHDRPMGITGREALIHRLDRHDAAHDAHKDDLTKLANRQGLALHMRSPAVRADIARGVLAVLVIDIDRMKEINARLGHAAGDAAICHVAHILRAQCGPGDLVCRTGGDEFNLIFTLPDGQSLHERVETVRRALSKPLAWHDHTIPVSVSIGTCPARGAADIGEALIQRAETALGASKARGAGSVVQYTDDLGLAQRARQQLAQDLTDALCTDQFDVYLQPQLRLSGDGICGCEALIRWHHPRRGVLSPGAFMAAAESLGVVARIDYLSMTKALDALKALHEAGFDHLTMAINVSASVLADPDYPDRLGRAIQSRGLRPDQICIELLETTILDGSGPDVETAVLRLKRHGVRVALDDFGTGYAGVAHMASIDADVIKIDRAMIARLGNDPRTRVIVRGVIRLCRLLRMDVVAEGVETAEQLAMLRRAGCAVIQGFGLARPMPLASLLDWLAQREAVPRASGDAAR